MAIQTSGVSETERELASGSSKGSLIQVRWASMPITTPKSMSLIRLQLQRERRITFHRGPDSNTIRDITRPMY